MPWLSLWLRGMKSKGHNQTLLPSSSVTLNANLNAKPGPRVISHQLGASTGFSILVTRTFLSLQSRPVSYFF